MQDICGHSMNILFTNQESSDMRTIHDYSTFSYTGDTSIGTTGIVKVDHRELERFMKQGFMALGVRKKTPGPALPYS